MCRQTLKKALLYVLPISLLLIGVTILPGQQQIYSPPPQPGYGPAPVNPAQPEDGDDEFAAQWPIRVTTPQGEVTIFQPQMEELVGDTLSARTAVSIMPPNTQAEPIFGAVWFKGRVFTDRVSRQVQILDVAVTRSAIADAAAGAEQSMGSTVQQALKDQPIIMSMDQLLTMVETAHKEDAPDTNLQDQPPTIRFIDHPAILVQYDDQPQLTDVPNSNIERVANTPFFVVRDPNSRTFYLKGAGLWFAAPDALGPFQRIPKAPDAVAALADAQDYKDPQDPLPADQVARLEIVTATDPTELVWTDGPPKMGTIAGTNLLYVTNTDSDVITQINTQQTFVLLSGRWYAAKSRNGPWAFVPPDQLPEDFKRIPPNSDQGDVLAHVAGTQAAEEAVADTYVPQTAAIDRRQFEQPSIDYDGDPQFDGIEGTSARYAVNTSGSVVFVEGRYYNCYDAVWYVSASPRGPWDICTVVPAEIYRIPPSCPIYPVRYVYVYNYTPDIVYCGYTPGYVGSYVHGRVVVYGTGYRYRPWRRARVYYPRPYTYGFAARYNSYVNHWGFSFGLATGGGSLWLGYSESPRIRNYRDPWFCGGYRPVVLHRDVHRDIFRRGYIARVREERMIRDERGAVVRRDNDRRDEDRDVFRRNVYERRPGVRQVAAIQQRDTRNPAPAAQSLRRSSQAQREQARRPDDRNEVLADRDGKVMRRTANGWEVREGGRWSAAPNPPAETAAARNNNAPAARPSRDNQDDDDSRPVVRRTPTAAMASQEQPQRQQETQPRVQQPAAPRSSTPERPQAPQPQPDRTPAARDNDTPARGRGNDNSDRPAADARNDRNPPNRESIERPDRGTADRDTGRADRAPDRPDRESIDRTPARGRTGPGEDRPAPSTPAARAPAQDRPAPDRPAPTPARPAPERPAQERQAQERPQPERPTPPPDRGNDRPAASNRPSNDSGSRDTREVDRDLRAREQGNSRLRNYQPEAERAPERPAQRESNRPAPRNDSSRGNANEDSRRPSNDRGTRGRE